MMKKLVLIVTIFGLTKLNLQAQSKSDTVKTAKPDTAYKFKYLFENAYTEIKQMLDDKMPISFKRAIFLTENAFCEGRLNEKWYNSKIDR